MKSFACIAFLLTIFAAVSFAAVEIRQYKDPNHPGKCTIKDNLILSPGQIIKDPDEDCGRIVCEDEDGNAQFQTCGPQRVARCKIGERRLCCKIGDYVDKSLQFPDCCQRKLICK